MSKKIHTPWWLSGGAGLVFGAWFEISTLRAKHTLQEIFTTSLIWDVIVIAGFVCVGFIAIHERLDRRTNALRSKSK